MKYITLKDNSKYYFDKLKIMGIINVTPDSFYCKSRVCNFDDALEKAKKMIDEGVDIIDIGGESTRPGSLPIDEAEEIQRIVPIIKGLKKYNNKIIISADTYRAKTAEEAIKAGADIINDISGLTFDSNMKDVVIKYNVPIIIMHIKGQPKNMQKNPQYKDVVTEVMTFLNDRANEFIKMGGSKEKIIIDPGIGFGKDYTHNMELIKRIKEFHSLDFPILLAVSRKSSIGQALGGLDAENRLEGTMAVTCYAAFNGIEMVRVHDVKENKRAAQMIEAILNE